MKNILQKHRKISSLLGASVTFLIAVIYFVVTPLEVASVEGIQKAILLYGHTICWILLSLAALVWGTKLETKWSKYLSYGALTVYVTFIATLLLVKFNLTIF